MHEICSAEIVAMELTLEKTMRDLIESDPNAILRIEKIFHKIKVERSVENYIRREDGPKH